MRPSSRAPWAAVACIAALGAAPAPQRRLDRLMADELFEVYRTDGPGVLATALASPTASRVDRFRDDFETRVLPVWRRGPHRAIQAMFMLDLAIGMNGRRAFPGWEDFITRGSEFLAGRADPPGASPAADAFEILWHKTAVAFLDGLQDPVRTDRLGIQPMAGRFAAVPAAAGAPPVLVDPWVELVRGRALERITLDRPEALDVLGPEAVKHFRQATSAGHPDTSAEAASRAAALLIRLARPADALATLADPGDVSTADRTFRFWRELLRGKALEALGRADDAVRAYEEALRLAPSAETPRIAMLALATRRGRSDDVAAQLAALHATPDPVVDPWRTYRDGDARLLPERLSALREMSRR
jgi:hypothetical protein